MLLARAPAVPALSGTIGLSKTPLCLSLFELIVQGSLEFTLAALTDVWLGAVLVTRVVTGTAV